MPERISVSAHLMLFEGQVKKRVAFEFFLGFGHSFLDFFNLAVWSLCCHLFGECFNIMLIKLEIICLIFYGFWLLRWLLVTSWRLNIWWSLRLLFFIWLFKHSLLMQFGCLWCNNIVGNVFVVLKIILENHFGICVIHNFHFQGSLVRYLIVFCLDFRFMVNSLEILLNGLLATWIKNVIFKKINCFGFMKGQTNDVCCKPGSDSGPNLINQDCNSKWY